MRYREIERRLERLEQEAARAAVEGAPGYLVVSPAEMALLCDPDTPLEVLAELEERFALHRGVVKIYQDGCSPADWDA